MNWEKYKIDELRELYSLANTAGFIYQQFRASAAVKAITTTIPSNQLINELQRLLAQELSLDMVVKAYACIAALSLAEPVNGARALAELDLQKLRFGRALVSIMESKAVPTTLTIGTFRPQPAANAIQLSSTNTRTTIGAPR